MYNLHIPHCRDKGVVLFVLQAVHSWYENTKQLVSPHLLYSLPPNNLWYIAKPDAKT